MERNNNIQYIYTRFHHGATFAEAQVIVKWI